MGTIRHAVSSTMMALYIDIGQFQSIMSCLCDDGVWARYRVFVSI